MSEQNATRDQILDTAADLLRRLTYPAFSYSDISAEVGIRKASIHYYFPSKEDLGLALVQRFIDDYKDFERDCEQKGFDPKQKLEAYFEYFLDELNEKRICPLGSFSATSEGLPEQLKFAVKNLILIHRTWLRETISQAQDQNLITKSLSENQISAIVGSGLLGCLQIARAMDNAESCTNLISGLKAILFKE